jgi:hypothetical protein
MLQPVRPSGGRVAGKVVVTGAARGQGAAVAAALHREGAATGATSQRGSASGTDAWTAW